MGKLVVTEFITLDSVIEDPGGSENLDRGGWALQFDRGEEGNKFKLDEVFEAEAQLLGRVTYEGFADAWPSRDGEFADKFNGMQKYVVSSTLRDPEWNNSRVVSLDEISALREAEGGDILVNGSGQLVAALLDPASTAPASRSARSWPSRPWGSAAVPTTKQTTRGASSRAVISAIAATASSVNGPGLVTNTSAFDGCHSNA